MLHFYAHIAVSVVILLYFISLGFDGNSKITGQIRPIALIVVMCQLIIHGVIMAFISLTHSAERYFYITTLVIDLAVFIACVMTVRQTQITMKNKDIQTSPDDKPAQPTHYDSAIERLKDLQLKAMIALKSRKHHKQ